MKKELIFHGSLVALAQLGFGYGEYGLGAWDGHGYGDGPGYGLGSVDGSGHGVGFGSDTNWAPAGAEVMT